MASGSDHGCSSVILWDTRSWSIISRIQAHSAAVTGIVDLHDGKHFATGSYDKKINIYNIGRNQVTSTLNNNRTSVTGMVMASSGNKLVTSGLDKSITVWSITRNAVGVHFNLLRPYSRLYIKKLFLVMNWSASCSNLCFVLN